ncbi:hypothetical protein DPMN_187610 [Dreissena polymorpha]|uniref:Uncharacterized protein n=1 Tax=Dreissena polymorpha TaxID=45954 RepID=A0A9D4DPU0_DREPO|nr:hypothetical protein DPMN_187610 [Dreissena polymorpha]
MASTQQNTTDNVNANVAVIVGIVTAAIVVFAAVLVTVMLVYKYKSQNNVRRIRQSEVSLQPFPLYNLPVKTEKMEPAKDTFMNRYNF